MNQIRRKLLNLAVSKKPVQLKLASMSEHWNGMPPTKSGKHRSQEMQKRLKRWKNAQRNRKKQKEEERKNITS